VKVVSHLSSAADAKDVSAKVVTPPAAGAAANSLLAGAVDSSSSSSSISHQAERPARAPAMGHLLPALGDVQRLLEALQYDQHGPDDFLTVEQLQQGLEGLGYRLEPSEVLELAKGLGYGVEGSEGVALSQFAASQLDWEALQVSPQGCWCSICCKHACCCVLVRQPQAGEMWQVVV
jgi:hypothetical protein